MSARRQVPRRQIFVLTPEEKRVLVFVLVAFVLGLGAKHYRDSHPQPPPSIDKKHPWRTHATTTPSPSPQKAQRKPQKKKQTSTPLLDPSIVDQDRSGGE
jgi:hypothetical protein